MRLDRLVARGFRNLHDVDRALPESGVALLGANGQGKTNLLEAIYYPVLFRSLRGAADTSVAAFGGPGFHLEARIAGPREAVVTTTFATGGRRKRVTVDGAEIDRLTDAVGIWMAVAFLPADVALAAGGASERRRYLDRMLSLADGRYLRALIRYRAALAQRNSALRQGRTDMARAFDAALAEPGSAVVAARLAWAEGVGARFAGEVAGLGETAPAALRYRGRSDLADPAAWSGALAEALPRDRARGTTTIGPQRDELILEIGGRPAREFGSTGQQRSAAIALKLLEIDTLREARGTEPALVLDDVFAELDRERQRRLAARLAPAGRQVFVTAPRRDELPEELGLPVWELRAGEVREP